VGPQRQNLSRRPSSHDRARGRRHTLPAGGWAYYGENGWEIYNGSGQFLSTGSTPTTRTIFLADEEFGLDGAIAAVLGTQANGLHRVINLIDGITSGAFCSFMMPTDAATGTITIRPSWVPSASDATPHTVRWQMRILILSGATITNAATAVPWTGVSAARTVNVEVLETGSASTGVTPAAGDRVWVEIQRVGGDGLDTYVGNVYLKGLRIDYSATS
jgi:hypothetical protein